LEAVVIVELVVEAEYNEHGLLRIGLKPTAQSPWVIVMLLEAVVRQIEMAMLVQKLDERREARGLASKLFRPPGS